MLDMQKRLDDAEKVVKQTERFKAALEERFHEDFKAVHQANAELRLQLSSQNSGKSDLSHRMERLQISLNEYEKKE